MQIWGLTSEITSQRMSYINPTQACIVCGHDGPRVSESKALIDVKPGANLLQIGGQDVEAAARAAGKACFVGIAFRKLRFRVTGGAIPGCSHVPARPLNRLPFYQRYGHSCCFDFPQVRLPAEDAGIRAVFWSETLAAKQLPEGAQTQRYTTHILKVFF